MVAHKLDIEFLPFWEMPDLAALAGLDTVPDIDNAVNIASEEHTMPPTTPLGEIHPASALIFLQGSSDNLTTDFLNSFETVEWLTHYNDSSECDIEELNNLLEKIEDKIQKIIDDTNIRQENIVIAGVSEGGFMTLWTALFTKYKLGGFLFSFDIFSKSPLVDIYRTISKPVNQNTPIIQFYPLEDEPYYGFEVYSKIYEVFNAIVEAGSTNNIIDVQKLQ